MPASYAAHSRILRGHTPDILCVEDEDMVPTAWRHAGTAVNVRKELRFAWKTSVFSGKASSEIPCRVSSDPHEWRNELSAVSGRDSAKLQYL